ncbi:hypothetical protein AMTR_s00058p00177480 [Amborella trichopoda]|uniref:Uncharacterized protein n=1 Tax=Amborella trichopoda TaxID=13333 RepID=W1PHQ5_AMBTC|nr:hypothetical protein AMTR_s00058p00177480 [Amborella trichopoda]
MATLAFSLSFSYPTSPLNPKSSNSIISVSNHIKSPNVLRLSNHSRNTEQKELGCLKHHLLVCLTCSSLLFSSPEPLTLIYPFIGFIDNAEARGLFQMPPVRLNNRFFLVRAGESEMESKGIVCTNPVSKTSVDSGLSEEGKKQSVDPCCFCFEGDGGLRRQLLDMAINHPKIIPGCRDHSLLTFGVLNFHEPLLDLSFSYSFSHIVPEYSFLDARAFGAYEGRKLESLNEVYESDRISPRVRPPPVDNGTPNESVEDVFVRVTQLMSIIETQYSGDNIIIVSPDSDNLTVLQAGLIGLDLRRHRDLSFGPGEVRYVDPASVPAYKQPPSAMYQCLKPPNCT